MNNEEMMECCKKHMMSRKHLEMKKEILEDKLQWIKLKLREMDEDE